MKNKGGRPPKYSLELAKKICDMIADGYTLRQIQKTEGMPTKTQILRWALDTRKPEFCDLYAKAMQVRLDRMAQEIVDICDDCTNDWMEREGKTLVNNEAVNRARLRVDTRKWLLSKLAPQKYGDKQQIEHSGTPPIAVIEFGTKDPTKK
jgi:hypothetical protein